MTTAVTRRVQVASGLRRAAQRAQSGGTNHRPRRGLRSRPDRIKNESPARDREARIATRKNDPVARVKELWCKATMRVIMLSDIEGIVEMLLNKAVPPQEIKLQRS